MLSGDTLTQVAYELQGNTDLKRLEQAWAETVAEHPSLRSVFRRLKNRRVQVLLKHRPIPIEWQDLRGMEAVEQQDAYQTIVNSHREPIQIDEGPLIRLALCRLDEDQTILLWTHHPLCMDDSSRDMIVNEWLDRVQGTVQAFPQRRSYQDYLKWEAGRDEMPAKKYWTEQLADVEPAPMLQTMRGWSEDSDSGPCCCRTVLSEELSRRLEQVAKRYQVSVEALSLTAWMLLLNMYSGEESVSCGATVPGRPEVWEGAESMIGPFAHALPIRATLSADQQVNQLLALFQKQWERLLTFGNIPEEMVRTYAGISEKALLFDSLVTLRHKTGSHSRHPQLLYRAGREQMEVMITVGPQWEVELVRPQGVSFQALEVLRRHFVTLLENIVEQPEAQLHELNLLSDEEEQRILQKVNKTRLAAPPLHRLAHQVIEERVAERPDAIAAVCGEESITYGELNERANRLAYWLRDQGLGRDDLLAALLAERSIEMLVGILAVLKAGGAYVPLDSAHPDHRLRSILQNSGAKLILTESGLQSRSLELSTALSQAPVVFSLDEGDGSCADVDVLTLYPEGNPALINEPEDLANVFYTSGSTGQPKGAMIEQIGMLNHLYAKINLLGLNEKSVVVQNASHCFDISVWQFLAPLMTGGRVVIYNNDISTDPQALFRSVQSDRVTVLEMVPPMIEMFLQESTEYKSEQRLLPELQYMISTGEGLPVSLCRKWRETFSHVKVVNTYGATECSDDTSHEVIDGAYRYDDHPQVALGTSIPNIHHYVLDAWRRPVPAGCIGEVYITGIGVGRGYLNDPKRTSKAYLPNPFADGMGERMYKTGDLARLMPDGRLVFVSRADFQVKVRGYRIELGEIEAALLSHPLVSQCLALVRPDESGNNRILAYVVLHEDIDDILELRQYLQAQLPDYMVPEHLIVLQAMPLNRNGKIDRKALPEPDGFGQIATGYTAPRNHWESVLVAIWEEVLGVDRIGIDDNFFNLGGHSLKTIQIRSRIRQQLGVDMELKDLFDHQTVRELAPLLEAAQAGVTEKTERMVPQAEQAEFYPMSHAQQRLFLLHRLEPDNRSYNMPVAVELMGSLDPEVFQKAIRSLQERHEGLRTTFTVHAGKPVQRVAESLPLDCPLIDLSDRDETAQQQYMEKIEREEAETYFDLTEGPLFRIRLCKLAKDRHVLWMNMYHIISDYWSWQVLIRDFAALYHAFHQGKTPSLPPLTVQYKDYASWQNDRLERGELAEAESYWLEQFSGELPVLDLPTDHPRPPIQTFTAAKATVALGPDRLKRMKALAQEQEATLFMTLLSAVGAFLSRMSGQQDLVIGTPEAGRNQAELEDLIGFFVNTLPLRLNLRAEQTFIELLQHCKRIALDAYTHHEYPFDRLVEKVKPERDLSRSPIFSVMFQLDQPTIELPPSDLNLRPLPTGTHMTNFDLTIVGVETESGLDIQFKYRSDLYEEETVNRWLEQFVVMVDGILQDPTQNISEYPLLPARQRQWFVAWNDTEVKFPQEPVHERFAAIARQMPDETAVEAGGVTITYRELNWRTSCAEKGSVRMCWSGSAWSVRWK